MSQIRPFTAIRYATTSDTDLSTRLAPPYDVLSDDDKRALLEKDAHNFVKIDLPHTPPKAAGPAAAYEGARADLDAWLAAGVLTCDATPAIYVYHQHYSHAGREYVRKMFFARLKLEPLGEGSLFPHEQTFGGPKEDRLALTKATQANLSPIFGLYPDAGNAVAAMLDDARGDASLVTGSMDGVENRMWAVTDPGVIARVTAALKEKPTFIADGHHRTGTAMLYRDWLTEKQGALPEDHPANYVLCVFCAMEDPGLLILPTHRVLPGENVTVESFIADGQVEVKTLGGADPLDALTKLPDLGPQAVALYSGPSRECVALRPANPDILSELAPERSAAWRRLGLTFLHAYLLDRVIAPKQGGGKALEIHYVKSDAAAIAEANETGGSVFLMQPTTMEELRGVCQAGDLMPQKSTFFYPKLASGLVINPLS